MMNNQVNPNVYMQPPRPPQQQYQQQPQQGFFQPTNNMVNPPIPPQQQPPRAGFVAPPPQSNMNNNNNYGAPVVPSVRPIQNPVFSGNPSSTAAAPLASSGMNYSFPPQQQQHQQKQQQQQPQAMMMMMSNNNNNNNPPKFMPAPPPTLQQPPPMANPPPKFVSPFPQQAAVPNVRPPIHPSQLPSVNNGNIQNGNNGFPPPNPNSTAPRHQLPAPLPNNNNNNARAAHQPLSPSSLPRPNLTQAPPLVAISNQIDQSGNPFPSPPASRHFVALDNGQATARFVRLTSRYLPNTSSMQTLPLAVLVTPFADPVSGENPVPVISHMPVRCTRCKAFINSLVSQLSQSHWGCNVCGHTNEFSAANPVSPSALELKLGSVDYDVTDTVYAVNKRQKPVCMRTVFVLDACQSALRSGLFQHAAYVIGRLCRDQALVGAAEADVAVVTFDEECVQFYDVSDFVPKQKNPKVCVVCDYENGFSPLPPSAMFLSVQNPDLIDSLLGFVVSQFALPSAPLAPTSVGGCALLCACESLVDFGGNVIWLVSTIPSLGQGRLADRDLPALIGKEEEATLFQPPKTEVFYNTLSVQCVENDICVHLLVCGAGYFDCAALAQIPSSTGGRLERMTGFHAGNSVHRQFLHRAMRRMVGRPRAFSTTFKLRTSSGVKLAHYRGHGFPDSDGNLKLSAWASDFCVACELEHDGTKLEPYKSSAVLQAAVLYYDCAGRKKLRVHTVSMPVRESPDQIEASADAIALALFFAKRSALLLGEQNLTQARHGLLHSGLVQLLKRPLQRMNTPPNSGSSPLAYLSAALSESQLCLPLFVQTLLKSQALVLNKPLDRGAVEPFARADSRVVTRYLQLQVSPEEFHMRLYPFVYELQNVSAYGEVLLDPTSNLKYIRMPPRLPCSSEYLKLDGVYFFHDGGDELDLFFGSQVAPQVVESILGTSAGKLNAANRSFILSNRNKNSEVLTKLLTVANILMKESDVNYHYLADPTNLSDVAVNVVGLGDFSDFRCFAKIVEDKVGSEQSYASFMPFLNSTLMTKSD